MGEPLLGWDPAWKLQKKGLSGYLFRLAPGGGPRGSLKEGCVLQKGVSLELPWGSRELVVSLEKGGWLGQMLGGVVLGISRFALGLVTSPPPFFGTSCFQ